MGIDRLIMFLTDSPSTYGPIGHVGKVLTAICRHQGGAFVPCHEADRDKCQYKRKGTWAYRAGIEPFEPSKVNSIARDRLDSRTVWNLRQNNDPKLPKTPTSSLFDDSRETNATLGVGGKMVHECILKLNIQISMRSSMMDFCEFASLNASLPGRAISTSHQPGQKDTYSRFLSSLTCVSSYWRLRLSDL